MKNLSFCVDGSGAVTLLTDTEAKENDSFGYWSGYNHKSGVPGYRWAIWPIGVTYVQICEDELARRTTCGTPVPDKDIYPPAIKAVLASEAFAVAVKHWPVKPVLPKVYREPKKLTPRAWLVQDGKAGRLKSGSKEEVEALSQHWAGYCEQAGNGLYWWHWASYSGERVSLVNLDCDSPRPPANAPRARAAFLAVWEKIKDKPRYAGLRLPVAYQEESND